MRITDLLRAEGIQLNTAPSDKAAAIDLLADLQDKAGNISDKALYKKGIWAREELDSTAVENGVAIPHAKSPAVKRAGLAAMTVPGGVDYGAENGEPSTLFFMIAAPESGSDVHLDILAHLAVMLMDEEFCAKLVNAKSVKDFLALIDAQEREKFPEEAPKETAAKPDGSLRVLAVPRAGHRRQGGNAGLGRCEEHSHPRGNRRLRRHHHCS